MAVLEASEQEMRLDKYLANIEFLSRSKARKAVRGGGFYINGKEVRDSSIKVEEGDLLQHNGVDHTIRWNVHIRLWKPVGYVSSDKQEWPHPSYEVLLDDFPYTGLVHIAGRLDVDTEGLLILTSNGQLNHRIISPNRNKEKEYRVTTAEPITPAQCRQISQWVRIHDGPHTYVTRPANAEIIDKHTLVLTLTEGKYHQVKNMLEAVWNAVVALKRTRVWPWTLDGLEPGWREYIDDETLSEFEGG